MFDNKFSEFIKKPITIEEILITKQIKNIKVCFCVKINTVNIFVRKNANKNNPMLTIKLKIILNWFVLQVH